MDSFCHTNLTAMHHSSFHWVVFFVTAHIMPCTWWQMSRVNNGSKFPVQFRVLFYLEPECTHRLYPTIPPDPRNWVGFTSNKWLFNVTHWASTKYLSSNRMMSWSIRRLYSLAPLSLPAIRVVIWKIFVQSPLKTCQFFLKCQVNPQLLNQYWSHRKSNSAMWKRDKDSTIHVLIMLLYNQNSNT